MIKYHSWELFEPIKLKLLNQKMQVSWWSLQDESTWRANQEQIKSKSRAYQEQINIFNQFQINISNQNFNQYHIKILHEKILIEILILKFTFQINSWEDQNLDCNHYAMLRVVDPKSIAKWKPWFFMNLQPPNPQLIFHFPMWFWI